MKKIILLLGIIGSFTGLSQTTHRITAGMNLQTEIDNAISGDIFYVEMGNYGDIILSKKTILFGTGYFNGSNSLIGSAALGKVKFNSGSANSTLSGFKTNDIVVSANNLHISKNYSNNLKIGLNELETEWSASVGNLVIKQNLFKRLEIISSISTSTVSNFLIKNNLFSEGFSLQGFISGEILYNTFDSDISPNEAADANSGPKQSYNSCGILNEVSVKNNILTHVSNNYGSWCPITSNPTTIFSNNILHAGVHNNFTVIPNNIVITNIIDLYVGYPNNPNNLPLDARNQLAPNSPAKGAGEGGTDAGAFGGDEPYVLSGIPSIPSIYQLTVPSQVQQGGTLNVQIKAKVNN